MIRTAGYSSWHLCQLEHVIMVMLAGKRCRGNEVCITLSTRSCVISQHVLAAGVVFTTASDLHDARFLCILTVLATVLTVFFTRTIARRVRALVFILVLSHLNYSPNRWLIHPGLAN
jgi:hypothetical protein